MSDSLDFKSLKDLKELCKQFGIRTAGVKHEDLVRLLRTKLHTKDEVTCRSSSLRGIRNGSMKDNRSKSGRKAPRKKVSGSFERTRGPTVLHEVNGVDRRKEEPAQDFQKDVRPQMDLRSNGNARLFFTHSDVLAEEENGTGDAFSSADMDSLGSLADLPSECGYFDDMIPYPFEIAEEFEHDIMTSSETLHFLDDHQFHDVASSKTYVAQNGSSSTASDHFSLETAFSDELLSLVNNTPSEELSLFAIPDWVSMSVVDDPPLLDWEKRLDSDPATKGPHVSEGNQLRQEVPIPSESLGGGCTPDCGGAAQTTEEHNTAEIESTLGHNMVCVASSPAARELGADSEAHSITSSASSTQDLSFDLGFREEEYVTSDETFSELSLLPATDLVDSILLLAPEEGHYHLPAPGSVDQGVLITELQEQLTDHTPQPVRLLGALDDKTNYAQEEDHHVASQVQQLVKTETTQQVQPEDEGTNFAKGSAVADNPPADARQQPIDSSLEAKFAEKEVLVSEDSAANSLPMSISENTLGDATKGHNTSAGIRRESLLKVGFPLSVILWCAQSCSSYRN